MTSCGGGGRAVFSELIVQTGGNRLIAPQSMLLILSKIDHQTYFYSHHRKLFILLLEQEVNM